MARGVPDEHGDNKKLMKRNQLVKRKSRKKICEIVCSTLQLYELLELAKCILLT